MATNFVVIMTDTQTRRMVSCYGEPLAATPNLDRLAASGVRHERAYTTCPLCTPARSALFTGQLPVSNGAWANNIAPGQDVAMMGTAFSKLGYRTAYTGKWHLDGGGYFGDGEPGGGFEPDWWYDGYRYADDIGPAAFDAYKNAKTPEELAKHGLDREENLWGFRVAERACHFLASLDDDESFLLVVSFDEPHGPFRCPPDYAYGTDGLSATPGYGHVPDLEPSMHRLQRAQNGYDGVSWEDGRHRRDAIWNCNRWIDTQIGRVVDAVDARFGDNTVIVYTTDHGEQQGEHGLTTKGPMMYDESVRIPFITRVPGGAQGEVSQAPVSHLDLMPTLLDLAGAEVPPRLQGLSQSATWHDPATVSRDSIDIQFTRFAVNHDGLGGHYPIRCRIENGWKLIINCDDEVDQLFDTTSDPHELHNRIYDPTCANIRDRLHDHLLARMDETRDPFRGPRWSKRSWRSLDTDFIPLGGIRRDKAPGFSWEPKPIEARD